MNWGTVCSPTFLFVVAFAISITPHEAVHGLVAYGLGFNATLFHMWVNPDTAGATPRQQALIAVAGPIFSLAAGVVSGLLYGRFKQRSAGLLFLMLAIVGVYSFLGPLAGAALGGDFNTALSMFDAPKPVTYTATIIGLILLPSFMFVIGRELLRWAPRDFSRIKATTCIAIAPWLVGTALTLLIYWPLPPLLVAPTISGSVFWAFAVAGASFRFSPGRLSDKVPAFPRSDVWIAFIAFAMVRLLTSGIRLIHS